MRIAAHTMVINGETFHLHVAEVSDNGKLIRHYPLTCELPHTIWTEYYTIDAV